MFGIDDALMGGVISGGLGLLGGVLGGNSAKDAANTQAAAQLEAARIAADAAKFRPVGVTTAFGTSNFGTDAQGNVNSAGYTLTPEMQAQLAQLQGASGQGLDQYLQSQGINQPLLNNAQTMFGMGGGYLSTSPQEQAQKYMAEQQALLAPSRERQYSQMQNNLFNTGRSGLRTGATSAGGMSAASPEMEAYYNAMMQQDNQLAANATQGGMDYAKFGAGMLGAGSEALGQYYGNQTAALQPYQATFGMMQGIDAAGQNALDIGSAIGGRTATAGANSGQLYQSGANNAAQSQFAANSYNPLATLLSGAGSAMNNYTMQQQNQANIDAIIKNSAPQTPYQQQPMMNQLFSNGSIPTQAWSSTPTQQPFFRPLGSQ